MRIIGRNLYIIVLLFCMSSCNYLDVIPTETPDIDDTMTDASSTLSFLYTCYGRIQFGPLDPITYSNWDAAGDDYVLPTLWNNAASYVQWGQMTAYQANQTREQSRGGLARYPWKTIYDGIGLCNQFIKLLDELNPPISQDTKELYKAEATFVKAYYHMRALQLFGPIPIMDTFMSQNTPTDQIPGRSHFDYCVDYIAGLFDQAAEKLPETWEQEFFGRGTSVIAKALKARLLVYAASPLWNSEQSPYANWQNKRYETPGYGKALVSNTTDPRKWERARKACEEALNASLAAGFRLFTIKDSETLRINDEVMLPSVPGIDKNTPAGEEFLQRVMMYRYMITAKQNEGNKENIWGILVSESPFGAAVPHYVLTNINKEKVGCWGGISPTLYAVEHFYTKNGKIPAEDESFPEETEWFQSAGITGNNNIIKLHTDREARFYAWISFDGDEYSSKIKDGNPLIINAREPLEQGYNPSLWGAQNYSVTGYLTKKYVRPNFKFSYSGGNNGGNIKYATSMIRMAELYLNLAECQAQLGGSYTSEAYKNLNEIRKRAGISELTVNDVQSSGKSLVEHILAERFIEFFQEGQRYYDIRRYLQGNARLSATDYAGLNAMIVNPSFDVFNQRTRISQPFKWDDRMYVLPVPTLDIYSNPQMVQAPGY